MFMRHDIQVIRELEKHLGSHPQLNSLYEIGCGSGQLLHFLSEFLPSIDEFHGIDLGENQIE
jgi:tRNA G46 methylase TrmB